MFPSLKIILVFVPFINFIMMMHILQQLMNILESSVNKKIVF